MQNNQTVGLSLDKQAQALACMCQDKIACPAIDLKFCKCPFDKKQIGSCVDIRQKDWLEYLWSKPCDDHYMSWQELLEKMLRVLVGVAFFAFCFRLFFWIINL